jgi:hypothetical protein
MAYKKGSAILNLIKKKKPEEQGAYKKGSAILNLIEEKKVKTTPLASIPEYTGRPSPYEQARGEQPYRSPITKEIRPDITIPPREKPPVAGFARGVQEGFKPFEAPKIFGEGVIRGIGAIAEAGRGLGKGLIKGVGEIAKPFASFFKDAVPATQLFTEAMPEASRAWRKTIAVGAFVPFVPWRMEDLRREGKSFTEAYPQAMKEGAIEIATLIDRIGKGESVADIVGEEGQRQFKDITKNKKLDFSKPTTFFDRDVMEYIAANAGVKIHDIYSSLWAVTATAVNSYLNGVSQAERIKFQNEQRSIFEKKLIDAKKVLNLADDFTMEDADKSFRSLAHKYHPDKPTGIEEKFKEINAAHDFIEKAFKTGEIPEFITSDYKPADVQPEITKQISERGVGAPVRPQPTTLAAVSAPAKPVLGADPTLNIKLKPSFFKHRITDITQRITDKTIINNLKNIKVKNLHSVADFKRAVIKAIPIMSPEIEKGIVQNIQQMNFRLQNWSINDLKTLNQVEFIKPVVKPTITLPPAVKPIRGVPEVAVAGAIGIPMEPKAPVKPKVPVKPTPHIEAARARAEVAKKAIPTRKVEPVKPAEIKKIEPKIQMEKDLEEIRIKGSQKVYESKLTELKKEGKGADYFTKLYQETFDKEVLSGKAIIANKSDVILDFIEKEFADSELMSSAYYLKREPVSEKFTDKLKPATTPDELKTRITQLNKFAQSRAILRKAGGIKRKAAVGQFVQRGRGVAKEGEVRLRSKYIANDSDYVSVLAHELGHGIEFTLTGTTNRKTYQVFGENLDSKTIGKIKSELKAITNELVGKAEVSKNPSYYNQPTELLAKFFEKIIVSPGNLDEIAPTAFELFEKQSVVHPVIREFQEAAHDMIDKGEIKYKPLRNLREIYQKYLGTRVGNILYDQTIILRAMNARSKKIITEEIAKKFKDITKKDIPLLHHSIESIKISRGGKPEYGTRNLILAESPKEENNLALMGFKKIDVQVRDGIAYPLYAKLRYTAEEGRQFFNQLSKGGKQFVLDFTAAKDEAKSFFNREVLKDTKKIESVVEGWAPHVFDIDKQTLIDSKQTLKEKVAGARLKRRGKEGYITDDFQKVITKTFLDFEVEKNFKDFLPSFFAGVTKPLPEGQNPDKGWTEVVGDIKSGVGTPQEKKVIVIKDGKKFVPKKIKYQMPIPIYEQFKLFKGQVIEASKAMKIVNSINRYWKVNVLAYVGTAQTNMKSGALQYASKVLTDFYTELFSGQIKFQQTRKDISAIAKVATPDVIGFVKKFPETKKNISAMFKTLMPKGWADAPDWVYGGDMSNWYGQFTKERGIADKSIDAYGNKALKLFGAYERYWKKVITTAENTIDYAKLQRVGKDGLALPTKEEKEIIAEINREIELYAYDYENSPLWLDNYQKSAGWQAVKPFVKYPYNRFKHMYRMVEKAFDPSLKWEHRLASLMALASIMGLYAAYSLKRRKEQETPQPVPTTPPRLSPRGRIFIGKDKKGKELFIRVAKYPFIAETEAGLLLMEGEYKASIQMFSDMIGSFAPIADMGLLALSYRGEYDTYKPIPVMIGESINSYVPMFRNLDDISRMLDPYKRKQETFFQAAIGKIIPTTSEELQRKLHGELRTIKIPVEGEIKKLPFEGAQKTTTERLLRNYWQDILLSQFLGIYKTRINPDEAKAFLIRYVKNRAEALEKEAKLKNK